MDNSINLNTAQCLKTIKDFGVDHIHNLCNGTVQDLPWGQTDWVMAGALFIAGVFMFALLGTMFVSMWRHEF